MKKKVLTLFAVLLCTLVVLNVTALADFGDFSGSSDYDFSYDYSDNDSSWSSSSSSSGSSYDDDGYVSGDPNLTRILIMAREPRQPRCAHAHRRIYEDRSEL